MLFSLSKDRTSRVKYKNKRVYFLFSRSKSLSILFGKAFALSGLIADFPVLLSMFSRASFATFAPSKATSWLCSNPSGSFALPISDAEASAKILRASSIFVILSRRLSFFNPLKFLYCATVFPLHSLVIKLVRMAYSKPSFTPAFYRLLPAFQLGYKLSPSWILVLCLDSTSVLQKYVSCFKKHY